MTSNQGNPDAQSISMRLQSLLQIPAIDKSEVFDISQNVKETTGKVAPQINAISLEALEKSATHHFGPEKENIYFGQDGFHNKGESSSPAPGFENRGSVSSNLMAGFISQSQNENTPVKFYKGQSFHPPRRLMELNTPYMSAEETSNSSNAKMGNEYSRVLAHISRLTESPECPQDVVENVHIFVKACLAAEESSSNQMAYFIALDSKVKNIFHGHLIETLNKKSFKFPRAKFYCNACNYHLDSITATIQHLTQQRHYSQEKSRRMEYTITNIPGASQDHTDALAELVVDISEQYGLTHSDQQDRLALFNLVETTIGKLPFECTVSMFGSSVSGMGFKDSDLNINVSFANEITIESNNVEFPPSPKTPASNTDHASYIIKIAEALQALPQFSNVRENYDSKKATISFESISPSVKCVIQFNNTSAVLLASLFEEYCKLDSRVRPLVLAFRYFARLCEIDDQENGYLAPHCYSIMVIHFLQEFGIIPVLHCLPKLDQSRPYATAKEALKGGWVPDRNNNFDLGRLWLNLFKYYALYFDYKDAVVTISRSELLRRTEKSWNRKLSIEDPIVPQSNVARSATSNKICEYIIDRVKVAYLHFAIPQTFKGPIYDGIVEDESVDSNLIYIRTIQCPSNNIIEANNRQIDIVDVPQQSFYSQNSPLIQSPGTAIINVRMTKEINPEGKVMYFILNSNAVMLHSFFKKCDFKFDFSQTIFWDGTPPPSVCKACGSERHTRKDCPEETIPPLVNISYPSKTSLNLLRSAILTNYDHDTLSRNDHQIRVDILDEIQRVLVKYFPDVQLTLFGSSQNGFGLRNSDVDICMTFQKLSVPPGENPLNCIDVNGVLMQVVNSLKESNGLVDILPITSAKVPIVKFRHRIFKLEGDISLYNLLALHNTALLKMYTDLDKRVRALGCFLKRLGKMCDISDASKGSLSSYGYILMLIHYLQHIEVPVLPVLQELAPVSHARQHPLPVRLIDNCNTYFYEDLLRLGEVWPGFQKNTQSLDELWLGFLIYYTEVFDFERDVVTIAQYQPLLRKEKSWYTEAIAIEDPFDKTHNLGAGLSRRMSVHIIKTFHRFREVFHSNIDHLSLLDAYKFYMDANKLRGGNPPIDRQCRLCYRIGHFARNCTYVGKPDDSAIDQLEEQGPFANQNVSRIVESPKIEIAKLEQSINRVAITNNTELNNYRQPMMNFDNNNRVYACAPMPIRVPFNNSNFVSNMYPQHLAIHAPFNVIVPHFSPPYVEKTSCLIDGYNFFWNYNESSQDGSDKMLQFMVKQSSGISFSEYLIQKADNVKQSMGAHPQTVGLPPGIAPGYQPGFAINGPMPPAFISGPGGHPVLCQIGQGNRMMYPIMQRKDSLPSAPPPPGFAPLNSSVAFPHPQSVVPPAGNFISSTVPTNNRNTGVINGVTPGRDQWIQSNNRPTNGLMDTRHTNHHAMPSETPGMSYNVQMDGQNQQDLKSGIRYQQQMASNGPKRNVEPQNAMGAYPRQFQYSGPGVGTSQTPKRFPHPIPHNMQPNVANNFPVGQPQRPLVDFNHVMRPMAHSSADNSHPPGFAAGPGNVHHYDNRRY